MTTQRITTGWRGFSLAKESAYGTAAAVDTAFNFEGPPTDIEIHSAQTDEKEVTGFVEPATHDVLNWTLAGTHRQRALPHNLAFFFALVLGKVTSVQPDNINDPTVYRHYIERDLSTALMKSVTLVEFDGIAKKQYPGIFGKSVTLSGGRDDFLQMEGAFGGMGKEASSAISKPAVAAESYLRYGDVGFTRGGSVTGSVAADDLAVTGGTAFQADLKSFEYSLDADPTSIYEMGDNSGYVSRVERGDRWTHRLAAVFEMQDDTHKTGLVNGTEYVLHLPVTGSVIPGGSGAFNFGCELLFPKAVYREAKKDRDGDVVTVGADFQVLEDATYGSVIVTVTNEQSGYLI